MWRQQEKEEDEEEEEEREISSSDFSLWLGRENLVTPARSNRDIERKEVEFCRIHHKSLVFFNKILQEVEV